MKAHRPFQVEMSHQTTVITCKTNIEYKNQLNKLNNQFNSDDRNGGQIAIV